MHTYTVCVCTRWCGLVLVHTYTCADRRVYGSETTTLRYQFSPLIMESSNQMNPGGQACTESCCWPKVKVIYPKLLIKYFQHAM